jgi:phosphomannomutase
VPTPACSRACTCWRCSAKAPRPCRELAARFAGYAASGEINSTVSDVAAVLASVRAAFAGRGVADDDDGVTITGDGLVGQRAGLQHRAAGAAQRRSTRQENTMAALRDEALAIIQGGTHE